MEAQKRLASLNLLNDIASCILNTAFNAASVMRLFFRICRINIYDVHEQDCLLIYSRPPASVYISGHVTKHSFRHIRKPHAGRKLHGYLLLTGFIIG